MKNAKKLLAMLLALVMCVGLLASCGTPASENSTPPADNSSTAPEDSKAPEVTYENKIILGNTTELGGGFRNPAWGGSSAGAADMAVQRLTTGYAAMESDQSGNYVWNETAVKSHSEQENDDGTITYTVTINEGLTYSDGTPITAKDYVVSTLAFSTPVAAGTGHPAMSGQVLVGFRDFKAYTGPGSETGTKEFSGIRLLDDYTYQITISSSYYPYYYSFTYAALSPDPVAMWLGEGVDIMDDGNGCYLSDSFYEKDGDEYVKAAHMSESRFDISTYPYSGPYVISAYDEGTKQATLTLNPEFKGNFEGQKASIETIVYVKIIQETQLGELTSGGVDLIEQVMGAKDVPAALAVVDDVNFSETHYQRAGYGKVEFECDFGPTMFKEVRQAIAYLLNRVEFCQTFTGGYGVVVHGPYSPVFSAWQAVQDDIELNEYAYSLESAKKVLEDGGWIYNSKGEPYVEGASGVDAVRYKKLTAEEAEEPGTASGSPGVNKTYASVANTDGVTYQTVKIGDDYYMPLAINWLGTLPNDVTDLLSTTLTNSSDLPAAGMVIRASTTSDFNVLLGNIYREPAFGYEGTPTFGMLNLATNLTSTIFDRAWEWSLDPEWFTNSSNKLFDEYDKAFPYDVESTERLSFDEAMAASGGKLGMDYLSMAMVYNATTEEEYNKWYQAYIERWNELVPDIPLYSNYYYDVYNAKLENYVPSPYFTSDRAIIYANVKGH